LLLTHAAGFFSSSEAESGTLGSNAALVTDATASGGQAVKFNAPAGGGSTCAGMAAVTNGQQITTSNTGYQAWCNSSNQPCLLANMTVYSSQVDASALISTGKTTCVWLKGGINIDADITLTACRIDDQVSTYPQINKLTLNYCTIDPPTNTEWPYSLGPDNFTAVRSNIGGSMDGVNFGGGTHKNTLIENYIRVKMRDTDDHNDGVQSYFASGGGTVLRNNIDARPVGGGGGPNAAFFIADSTEGEYEVRDNYLLGGGYTLRLHEDAYYRVTGNIIEKDSYSFGPLNTDNARTGAFLEWSNNKLSDGTVLTP
jgi:hypothetical protein